MYSKFTGRAMTSLQRSVEQPLATAVVVKGVQEQELQEQQAESNVEMTDINLPIESPNLEIEIDTLSRSEFCGGVCLTVEDDGGLPASLNMAVEMGTLSGGMSLSCTSTLILEAAERATATCGGCCTSWMRSTCCRSSPFFLPSPSPLSLGCPRSLSF